MALNNLYYLRITYLDILAKEVYTELHNYIDYNTVNISYEVIPSGEHMDIIVNLDLSISINGMITEFPTISFRHSSLSGNNEDFEVIEIGDDDNNVGYGYTSFSLNCMESDISIIFRSNSITIHTPLSETKLNHFQSLHVVDVLNKIIDIDLLDIYEELAIDYIEGYIKKIILIDDKILILETLLNNIYSNTWIYTTNNEITNILLKTIKDYIAKLEKRKLTSCI